MPGRHPGRPRRRGPARAIVRATVDTGWVIAASRNPTAARRHIAVLTRLGQVLVISPIVAVESRQRAPDLGPIDVVLAELRQEAVLPEDGRRASDLLGEAGRQATDASARIHEIGVADALIAAFAERLGGIVYTANPSHMEMLREAGADITVQPLPFWHPAGPTARPASGRPSEAGEQTG